MSAVVSRRSVLAGGMAAMALRPASGFAQTGGSLVDLGAKQLYHTRFGSGPPVIALHGGLGLDYEYFLPALTGWGDVCTLHMYDHEGNGRSSAPDDYAQITMETMADDVIAMADALGIERFTLMGHSYGGFIAQTCALRHPGRLTGLILANTSGRLGYDVVFPDWAPDEARAAVGRLFSEPMSSDEEWAETWRTALPAYWNTPDPALLADVHNRTTYRVAAMANSFGLLATFNTLDALPGLDVPTLILSGRDDFVTPYVAHEDLAAQIPNAQLVVFEKSGHFPFVTEGEALQATVSQWLADL